MLIFEGFLMFSGEGWGGGGCVNLGLKWTIKSFYIIADLKLLPSFGSSVITPSLIDISNSSNPKVVFKLCL